MAIKNTGLGGTDWATNEVLDSSDLNDTFDALSNKVNTLTAFWLNSDLSEVTFTADDETVGTLFDTGAPASGTIGDFDYSVSASVNEGSASLIVEADTRFDGTGNQYVINIDHDGPNSNRTVTCTVTYNGLTANKHTYISAEAFINRFDVGGDISIRVGATVGWNCNQSSQDAQNVTVPGSVLIVAKGNDVYDIYGPHKLVAEDVTIADLTITYRITGTADSNGDMGSLYFKKAIQSSGTVS